MYKGLGVLALGATLALPGACTFVVESGESDEGNDTSYSSSGGPRQTITDFCKKFLDT